MTATEDWWRGAVIYQIYPRSFRDSNGDGVGDLNGVSEKLDYVASLGVDGVWLSPFFRSPMKDFGYDVSDYRDVDPLFGTLDDFDALLGRAHALGLKVIIDQVWSHTSDRHPWFQASCDPASDKADWYVWADPKPDGSPPNNWQASFGGPSWTWNARRRQYYLHNFLPEQPDLNYWNPAVREAILDVARFWLDRGVDGFRLDVINYLAHDPALTDNPVAGYRRPPATASQYQKHIHDRSQPLALGFVETLRALMDGYAARMTVGEIFDEEPLVRQIEYVEPGRLHTAYSFFLLQATKATPALFAQALELLARRRRLALLVARQPRRAAVSHPARPRRARAHPRLAGGADGAARDDLPLPGRGAGLASGRCAVRASARPLRHRRLRWNRRARRRAHPDAVVQHGAGGGVLLAASTLGCRWMRVIARSASSSRPRTRTPCSPSRAGWSPSAPTLRRCDRGQLGSSRRERGCW